MTMPPLPTGHTIGCGIFNGQKLFTADQMREYGAACAAEERERCAALCEADMTDLISRLRDLHMQCDGLSLYAEAADEIERLNNLNSSLTRKANSYLIDNARLAEENTRMRSVLGEIEWSNDTTWQSEAARAALKETT